MDADSAGQRSSLEQSLLDRRIVMVGGPVDDRRATEVVAALLSLDALGDDPIELRLNAASDSLDVASSLVDTIDALGVRIVATVSGALSGTMVGPFAACHHRRIGGSARIRLHEPSATLAGPASDIERHARALDDGWHRYLRRMADATGRPFEHLEADHRSGRFLGAAEAVSYGLADEIAAPRRKE